MALNAYLTLKGKTLNEISGSSKEKGKQKAIVVYGAHHEITRPVSQDRGSNVSIGNLNPSPFIITKEVDVSSPLLYQILVTNENITEWILEYWQPSKTGKEVLQFKIELKDAKIIGIEHSMINNPDPDNLDIEQLEHITFTYSKMIWTANPGSITSQYDFSNSRI